MSSHQSNDNQAWMKRREKAIPVGIANAFPVIPEKANNAEIWDIEGNQYIDFAGGIAVMNTGHVHPKITQAAIDQIHRFSHLAFQVTPYKPYIELAERLNELSPGDFAKKTILFSSGAEAVENAVKIARAHTGRAGVIAFSGGFHGRSMMTMALTGKVIPYKKDFGILSSGVYHVPFPMQAHGVTTADSIKAIHQLFKADIAPEDVAAIILEPVQGEGGFYQAPPELMQALRDICDAHGIVLIADEVQTGIGRTGELFAMSHYPVAADLITTAKSLAAGYPLSGVIGRAEIMDSAQPGGLGGTYGGNPIACAAALAVLDVIEEEGLLEKSMQLGQRFSDFMNELKNNGVNGNRIGDIRHMGAMAAFEIVDTSGQPDPVATKKFTMLALELGLIVLSCGVYGNTIRILAPLTIGDETYDLGLNIIKEALAKLD